MIFLSCSLPKQLTNFTKFSHFWCFSFAWIEFSLNDGDFHLLHVAFKKRGDSREVKALDDRRNQVETHFCEEIDGGVHQKLKKSQIIKSFQFGLVSKTLFLRIWCVRSLNINLRTKWKDFQSFLPSLCVDLSFSLFFLSRWNSILFCFKFCGHFDVNAIELHRFLLLFANKKRSSGYILVIFHFSPLIYLLVYTHLGLYLWLTL